MKFQKQEATFQPITITIESVEELKFLWHRMNFDLPKHTYNRLRESDEIVHSRDNVLSQELWSSVRAALQELGEKA